MSETAKTLAACMHYRRLNIEAFMRVRDLAAALIAGNY